MQLAFISKRNLLIIAFMGSVISASYFFYLFQQNARSPVGSREQAISVLNSVPSGVSVRLEIPGIKLNAAVENVGLTADGAMDVPKNPANVGLYRLGPKPGEIGSAVIAGHFGKWKNGKGSVFDNLKKLVAGDRILFENDNGVAIGFTVREIRSFDPEADASAVFFSKDGKAHLNLITCEGVWNKVIKRYSKRMVVFADMEDFH
jgi:LPXTG-site transpeptidase (sortase) family protein